MPKLMMLGPVRQAVHVRGRLAHKLRKEHDERHQSKSSCLVSCAREVVWKAELCDPQLHSATTVAADVAEVAAAIVEALVSSVTLIQTWYWTAVMLEGVS